MVTTATQCWARAATVDPACAPTGLAAYASLPTAVTFWLTPTSWCVCVAPATKVRSLSRMFCLQRFKCKASSSLHLAHTSHKQHSVISLLTSRGNVNVCLCYKFKLVYSLCCRSLCITSVQVPDVMSALQVTSGTLRCLEGVACPASVTTTLTCMTPAPVMPRQASVSNVCITPMGTAASTANWVTMATQPRRAAGVSVAAFPGFITLTFVSGGATTR